MLFIKLCSVRARVVADRRIKIPGGIAYHRCCANSSILQACGIVRHADISELLHFRLRRVCIMASLPIAVLSFAGFE